VAGCDLYGHIGLVWHKTPQGIKQMSRFILLFINGAILTGGAVFIYPARTTILTGLLLLLPLLDRAWRVPDIASQKKQFHFVLAVLCLYGLITVLHLESAYTAISILFLVALPEEWFFRAYFMSRLESFFSNIKYLPIKADWLANITTSVFFALTHIPTQGWFGLSVFFPSLFFGWIYQKQKNLILVILLHALSNLIFILYVRDFLIWR
jgi:uncharacterized protein